MEKPPLHVRIDIDEAIESRRALLSAEINFINMIKFFKDFRKLRQQELRMKSGIRTELRSCEAELNEIESTLPEVRGQQPREQEKVKIEKSTRKKLEDELKEIREKLIRLS